MDEIYNLIFEIRKNFLDKTIWLYSGYTWEQLFHDSNFDLQEPCVNQTRRAIVLMSDVFIDGEFKEELKDVTLKWRGSKNQKVIDVRKSLLEDKIVLYCD